MAELKLNLQLEIDEVELTDAINQLPIVNRWSIIARLISQANLNTNELNEQQKESLKSFLTSRLSTL